MTTAAILYQKAGYETNTKRLMGRQAASEGFLKAISRHSTAEVLYCYTRTKAEFDDFCQRVSPWLAPGRSLRWIPEDNPVGLAEASILYRPDPLINQLAWQRRYSNPHAYSLCGVTHTLASKEVMEGIGDLLVAPVQPWDAVICTSTAVKTIMEQLLENWTDYLLERMGARPTVRPQLPIIPLGVDCDAFLKGEEAARARHQLRQQYGIGAEDLVVLFVGRLIFHAKAHPVPMYLAVERAAQTTAKKVHLIQAGWFEDTQQETAFKEGAASFCPGVNPIFVDGRQPDLRDKIWAIADVFVSLADNIQETFGLTPIEAMAAGLPVIVSDWNGYQDTVRPDVDGFRIATTLPPARCGLDFALNYYSDRLNYSTYVGHISLMTAVDVDACTQALITLFQHPELRQQMGTQGRQRARDGFDWQVVIKAYEALWQDLNERRTAHSPVPPTTIPFHPLCDDPCQLLAHYPTQQLLPTHRLTLGAMADPASLQRLRSTWMTNFGADRRLAGGVIDRLLAAIAAAGSLAVADILQHYSDPSLLSQIYLYRTLVYLMKFDILRLLPAPSQTGE